MIKKIIMSIFLIISIIIAYLFAFSVYSSKNDGVDIQKQTTQGNTKVILAFGGLIHKNITCFGNLSQVANKNGFDFIMFDYPNTYFSQDEVNKKVLKFLEENKQYKKIGIVGLSFGETVARNVIYYLSKYKNIKDKIIFHISLSGVSVWNRANLPKSLPLFIKQKSTIETLLSNKFITFNKNIIYLIGFTDKIFGHYLSKDFVISNSKEVNKDIIEQHIENASEGLNPGFIDRFKQIYYTRDIKTIPNIPFYSFYSENDDTFRYKDKDVAPKENAQYIINKLGTGELISIGKGGHATLVEYPSKWMNKIEEIFKKYNNIDNKNIDNK